MPYLTGPSEVEAERLSLIRYQLLAAQQAAGAPPPLNSLAINIMQDVVESALSAAGDKVGATLPNRPDFDKLFDGVVASLGSPPELAGMRQAAIAMNNARVGFKHHGNQVRDETIRRHLDVAVTLTNTLVELAFEVKLEAVSLLLFIKDEQARGLIERASALEAAGELLDAMFMLRLTFDLVVQDYEERKTVNGWYSIFQTKPSFYPSVFDLRDMGKGAQKMSEWIEALDGLTRLGALGVDLQRYAYFDAVAPVATYFASDHRTSPRVRFQDVTVEHFRASHLFVVDTAIKLGANDYTLVPSQWAGQRRWQYDPDYTPKERDLPSTIRPSVEEAPRASEG